MARVVTGTDIVAWGYENPYRGEETEFLGYVEDDSTGMVYELREYRAPSGERERILSAFHNGVGLVSYWTADTITSLTRFALSESEADAADIVAMRHALGEYLINY